MVTEPTSPTSLVERLRASIPDYELSGSWATVRRRAREWRWPATQMGIAAALAWLAAGHVVVDSAVYAPITAIGALGLGRERRLSRAGLLIGGLFLGVAAAEVVTPLIGTGWWQIGALMTASALIAGALIGRELAVTYAAINAVVLLTVPGSEGWLPSRLIAGLIGVATAVAVMLVIAPVRPVRLTTNRLRRACRRATAALDETARVLRDGLGDQAEAGDGRPLIALARRLDDEIESSHETVAQAREIVRWSPVRRAQAADVARLGAIAHELRPALRTASTIARLADRAAVNGITADEHVISGICEAAAAITELTDRLLTGTAPDDRVDGRASLAIDRLMSQPCRHAILIALQEEVRGLLADVAAVVDGEFDGATPTTLDLAAGAELEGVTFGRRSGAAG